MSKKTKHPKKSVKKHSESMQLIFRIMASILSIVVLSSTGFLIAFQGKVYPGISILDQNVSYMNPEEVSSVLESTYVLPETITLAAIGGEVITLSTTDLHAKYDYSLTAHRAYSYGRTGNPLYDIVSLVRAVAQGFHIGLAVNLDESLFSEYVATVAGSLSVPAIEPQLEIDDDDKVRFTQGSKGTSVDILLLRSRIAEALAYNKDELIEIPFVDKDPRLSEEEQQALVMRAQVLVGKSLTVTHEYEQFVYDDTDLLRFLSATGGYDTNALTSEMELIADRIEREPQDAKFTFDGGRVKEFAPSKEGVRLDTQRFMQTFTDALSTLETTDTDITAVLPVTTTAPSVANSEVNDLGIKELIGRGSSQFKGSISSRVYNVNLAATRLDGALIPPGEVFSFNTYLGDVSALTGYKAAYVIMNGQTVLGDGGGVCQVSTTMFRAAMDAGLPIVERRSHSYRVGYYEQDAKPGLDATVYSPTTDFKFLNDTPGHILIQAYPDTTNLTLVFELYGTSDGRSSTVTTPVVTGGGAPPEPLYIDDPNLPVGQTKQIDWAAWGARSQFDYIVERNGETIYEKTFYSNYQPWQAKYLRGTGPAQ